MVRGSEPDPTALVAERLVREMSQHLPALSHLTDGASPPVPSRPYRQRQAVGSRCAATTDSTSGAYLEMKLGPTPRIAPRHDSSPGRVAAIAFKVLSWAIVKAGLSPAVSLRHARSASKSGASAGERSRVEAGGPALPGWRAGRALTVSGSGSQLSGSQTSQQRPSGRPASRSLKWSSRRRSPAPLRVDEGFDYPVGAPAALVSDRQFGIAASLLVEADQPS